MIIKKRVYEIIRPRKSRNISSTIFDWSIVFLITANISIIIFDTLNLPEWLSSLLKIIEAIIVIIFTIEYILRLWTSNVIYRNMTPFKAALKHMFTFLMIMDLISIVPFYLQFVFYIDLNVLRIFRLFRIIWFFRIKREYIRTLSSIFEVFKKKATALFFSTIVILSFMIIASVLIYEAEKEVQPEIFKNAFDGLWWAINTITTIGYGDIYPITVLGRILGALFSLSSIGMIAIPTGIISSGFIEKARDDRLNAKERKRFCPYCGENIDE